MPPELIGKTIAQLKEMGAVEIAKLETRSDVKFHGFAGIETELSPESEEKMRTALKEMEDDDFDADYFVDSLSDTKFEMNKQGEFKQIDKK